MVRAEDIPVDAVQIKTPVYRPMFADFNPPLGTYHYTVTWQGIPAASAKVSIEREGMRYRLRTTARTYSAIDLFYRLRYMAEGEISAVDFLPFRSVFEVQENSRRKWAELTFFPNGEILTQRTRNGSDQEELRFNPNNMMLDPFSAAFLARSLEWSEGETKEFDTFNGRSRYLIRLTASEKTTLEVNDQLREVWVIKPEVRKLTTTEDNKKLREAWIYVSADDQREVLQIRSEVFIGSVRTRLTAFEPSTAPITGPAVAQGSQQVLLQ